ncbi:MAG: dihydropteroate synthase [Armatimonadota bacterium]|nr:dihydropteroate synthase [Armatimonadota bacterium]MDR7437241.1 dihydropteroate synthase [Armatimonadota bacterium]MDR7473041.1 dihydropteroate synthase [Armatimonadota bacterium]MDR7506161.1 dihydropteroate synthase [Armatimonadota bacterium]MDR7509134.1 dihydropteroate synthase [Armatimonadota bacterium]
MATDPLYWAWALVPLAPRGGPPEASFQRLRVIAPEPDLRQTAAELVRLGGWASGPAAASPPLQAHRQIELAATLAQYQRLLPAVPEPVARAVGATLSRIQAPPPAMVAGRHRLDFSSRVYIAGILNNTPDSFYDRGRYFGLDRALARAEEIVREGADVIEVGGETAQEGPPVPVDEEIRRVAPLVEELVRRYDLPVAVDTYKPDVARAALEAGAVLVNDISGAADPRMADVVAAAEAGIVVMHLHGRPRQRYQDLEVPSMMDWVAAFLFRRTEELVAAGVPRDRILVDPGLDFGKHPSRDLELMVRLPELRSLGYPIFVATSRKDYIRDLLGLPPDDLLEGTAAAVAFAIAQGANMLRVHDVRAMARVARMMEFFCGHASPAPAAAGSSGRSGRADKEG